MTLLQSRINALVVKHGSYRNAAAVLGIDHAYLWRLATGRKDDPSAKLLRKLRLKRTVVVTWEAA